MPIGSGTSNENTSFVDVNQDPQLIQVELEHGQIESPRILAMYPRCKGKNEFKMESEDRRDCLG